MIFFFLSFVLTAVLTALGHPSWIPFFGPFVAAFGYALFWIFLYQIPKRRFIISFLWFAGVHAIQLSWMTTLDYMGPFMLVVYVIFLGLLALQFGLFSILIPRLPSIVLAGIWTIFEWARLFFFTGFTWNPVGMTLSCSSFSIQLAAVFGVYGLTFFAMWTNLTFVKSFFEKSAKRFVLWVILALFPYGFGALHQAWVGNGLKTSQTFIAKLVDTNLTIEEKTKDPSSPQRFIPPIKQWIRIWDQLGNSPCNMIVFPEGAFPVSFANPICSLEWAKTQWISHFGTTPFPPLSPPFVYPLEMENNEPHFMATNAFFAQTLANHFGAEVVIGLNLEEKEAFHNAAFLFQPEENREIQCYAKQILVPVGEYLPFRNVPGIATFIAREYGLTDFFQPGSDRKIFSSQIAPFAVSICLEETHGEFVRKFRKEGASFLVSLSNDAWFPHSKLKKQHFDHAKLRAVENGVFLLRSCNQGITGVVDCFGKSVATIENGGVIDVKIPIYSYRTLYSYVGDSLIISLSFLLLLLHYSLSARKKLLLNGGVG